MIQERNTVSGQRTKALAGAFWLAAALLVQGTVGADIARDVRGGEERLELRMREKGSPPAGAVQPTRRNEESIDPWELVSV